MSEFKSYAEESRKDLGTRFPGELTIEQIQTGAMLRMADASEKMASNYTQLQNDCDWYRQKYRKKNEEIEHLNRRITSLKGVITKLKKQAKAANK